MFKKFKESAYWKASIAFLVCGGILIIFNNWISKARITTSFEAIGEAMMPIFIGTFFAFLLCPLYNFIVKNVYASMLNGSTKKSAQVGTKVVYGEGERPVTADERRRYLSFSRVIASVACLIMVIGLITLMVYAIVPQFISSCVELAETLPDRLATLSEWLSVHCSRFPILAKWVDNISNAGANTIITWVQKHIIGDNTVGLATAISNGVINVVNFVVDLIVGILIMVYLLNYKEKLFAISRKFVTACFKSKTADGLYEFSAIINETFIGFIVGRIIDSFIIGVLTYITLLVCEISFAPMISVIVGVTNVIPFFGPFIGAIPSFLILMLESPTQALWFLVIILIIQQLDGNVIGPKIVGNAIGIDSFWVLVAVLISGSLFGFAGMLFGVPVFAVIYRYVDKLTMRSLRNKNHDPHTSSFFTLNQYGVDMSDLDLDSVKVNEKNFLSRFKKTNAVQEEIVAEAIVEEKEEDNKAQELEEIKEKIAKELLNDK